MPEKIAYVGSVTVLDGPRVAFNREIVIEGYDKFSVAVPDTQSVVVNVGADTSSVNLLLMTASQYSIDSTKKLTFKVDSKAAQFLQEPLLIAGAGALAAMGTFAKVTFENKLGADVTIEVFIARDPTP